MMLDIIHFIVWVVSLGLAILVIENMIDNF